MRRRLQKIVEMFRKKGATSPEKAMNLQELGLPIRFEQAMHRRLGQTGIFVEVNGKYYLNEERLKANSRATRQFRGLWWHLESGSFAFLDALCKYFSYVTNRHNHCGSIVLHSFL